LSKTKDYLIFILAFVLIAIVGFGFYFFHTIQHNYEESHILKTTPISEVKAEVKPSSKLLEFPEKPINMTELKTKKNKYVTTTVSSGLKYYYQPKIEDSNFYSYYYPTENTGSKKINEVIVFKYGKNKHTYDDETEILIALRIFNEDADLEKANLIGCLKSKLVSEFGTDYIAYAHGVVYTYKNRVLIVEIEDYKVKAYCYLKLNSETIDMNLIEQIIAQS